MCENLPNQSNTKISLFFGLVAEYKLNPPLYNIITAAWNLLFWKYLCEKETVYKRVLDLNHGACKHPTNLHYAYRQRGRRFVKKNICSIDSHISGSDGSSSKYRELIQPHRRLHVPVSFLYGNWRGGGEGWGIGVGEGWGIGGGGFYQPICQTLFTCVGLDPDPQSSWIRIQ